MVIHRLISTDPDRSLSVAHSLQVTESPLSSSPDSPDRLIAQASSALTSPAASNFGWKSCEDYTSAINAASPASSGLETDADAYKSLLKDIKPDAIDRLGERLQNFRDIGLIESFEYKVVAARRYAAQDSKKKLQKLDVKLKDACARLVAYARINITFSEQHLKDSRARAYYDSPEKLKSALEVAQFYEALAPRMTCLANLGPEHMQEMEQAMRRLAKTVYDLAIERLLPHMCDSATSEAMTDFFANLSQWAERAHIVPETHRTTMDQVYSTWYDSAIFHAQKSFEDVLIDPKKIGQWLAAAKEAQSHTSQADPKKLNDLSDRIANGYAQKWEALELFVKISPRERFVSAPVTPGTLIDLLMWADISGQSINMTRMQRLLKAAAAYAKKDESERGSKEAVLFEALSQIQDRQSLEAELNKIRNSFY